MSTQDLAENNNLQVLNDGEGGNSSTNITPHHHLPHHHPSADPTTKPPDYQDVMEKPPTYEEAVTSFMSLNSESSLPPYSPRFDLERLSRDSIVPDQQPPHTTVIIIKCDEAGNSNNEQVSTTSFTSSNSLPSFNDVNSYNNRQNNIKVHTSCNTSSPEILECCAPTTSATATPEEEEQQQQQLSSSTSGASEASSSVALTKQLRPSLSDIPQDDSNQNINKHSTSSFPSLPTE